MMVSHTPEDEPSWLMMYKQKAIRQAARMLNILRNLERFMVVKPR